MLPTARDLGLEAVILCGPGNGLYPFVKDGVPKALLPVANIPMVHYPMDWCQKSGVKRIIIAIPSEDTQSKALTDYFNSEKYKNSAVAQELAKKGIVPTVVKTEGEDLGTADVIRYLFKKEFITNDFVVLPCDLIVEGIELGQLASAWMVEQVKFGLDAERKGALGVWHRPTETDKTQEMDLIGVVSDSSKPKATSSLVSSAGTIQTLAYIKPRHLPGGLKDKSDITLRHSFIKHYGKIKLHSRTHRDSHIYIFPKWIGELLIYNENRISSLALDLLPQWTKAIWNKRTASRLQIQEILAEVEDARRQANEGQAASLQAVDIDIHSMSTTQPARLGTGFSNTAWGKLNQARSVNSGTASPESSPPHSPTRQSSRPAAPVRPLPSITAIIAEPTSTFYIRRVDTSPAFLQANLHLAKSLPSAVPSGPPNQPDPNRVHPSCKISGIVTSVDSLLGPDCIVEQRAAVKRCVIGANVRIEKGARVLACVLLDGARVMENARLELCVVGRDAVIGKNASLKDCMVADKLVVEEGADEKGQELVVSADYDYDEEEDEEDESGGDDSVEDDEEEEDSEEDEKQGPSKS